MKWWLLTSCIFEKSADVGELFPANINMANNPVLKIAIKYNNKLLYFEGKLPAMFNYDNVYGNFATMASDSETITISQNVVLSEKELLQNQEVWKHSIQTMQQPILNQQDPDGLDTFSGNDTMQLMSELPELTGIPENVFKQVGVWDVAYISNAPQIGYYAETFSVSGTNNYVTYLIKWEYLYNECDTIAENTYVGTGGATGITIIAASEYTYYAVRDSIELTNTFIPYKIKNSAVAMGLQSDQQILSEVDRSMQAQGSAISVNWQSILGLLPLGTVYSTAVSLFSSIEYYNKDISTPDDTYQITAAGQKNAYGKLIRGHKLTAEGRDLRDEGDKLVINFTVRQPTDLTRTSRYNDIANQYYFEIYERNGFTLLYTTHVCTVNQTRKSSYYVE